MEIPELNSLNKYTMTEKYISAHFQEFHQYIIDHYPSDFKWTEKLYWYYHGLKERPECIVCGSPVKFINIKEGYRNYCSYKCVYKSDVIKEKRSRTNLERWGFRNAFQNKELQEKFKQTCLERYGGENISQINEIKEKKKQTCLMHFGVESPTQYKPIHEKQKQTCLKRYGVEYPLQSNAIQEKSKQTCLERYGGEYVMQTNDFKEKSKQTCLERYGVENPSKSKDVKEKVKQTNIERYGVECYTQTEDYKLKAYQTKKKNRSFNTSSIEESFATWLDSQNISYIRQYRSEDYPFNCDFYFPDKDLYLEIQGFWSHGFHPFDSSNPDDISIVNEWKEKNTDFYNNAIQVWTKSDPLKRETARKNNLNWIEVFSDDLDEVIKTYKESRK